MKAGRRCTGHRVGASGCRWLPGVAAGRLGGLAKGRLPQGVAAGCHPATGVAAEYRPDIEGCRRMPPPPCFRGRSRVPGRGCARMPSRHGDCSRTPLFYRDCRRICCPARPATTVASTRLPLRAEHPSTSTCAALAEGSYQRQAVVHQTRHSVAQQGSKHSARCACSKAVSTFPSPWERRICHVSGWEVRRSVAAPV